MNTDATMPDHPPLGPRSGGLRGAPGRADAEFDLIVVGGGIAGLSAAYYWLTDVDPDACVLIVEQSTELGGHSIRHVFDLDGHRLLAPGGAQELTFPSSFPAAVGAALADLGIDTDRFYNDAVTDHYSSHGAGGHGFAFAADVWGRNHLAAFHHSTGADLRGAPVAQRAKPQITGLLTEPTDWLAGRTDKTKLALLRSRSCDEFLRDFAALEDDTHHFLRLSTAPHSGMTFDQHPALDAALVGYVGLDGLGIEVGSTPWEGLTRTGTRFFPHLDPPIFRFPDGNSTVVRALAHRLVPDLFATDSVDYRLTAEPSTEVLDRPGNQVRIRTGAKALRLLHDGHDHVKVGIEARGGTSATHRAHAAIIATSAPDAARLAPELDVDQRSTAEGLGRYPIVSASVALRDWRAWQSLGLSSLSWPGHPTWQIASLEFPVKMGGVEPSSTPDAPVTVSALGCLTAPGMRPAAGAAAGRRRLASPTAPAEVGAELRHLLAGALAAGGFDADRDIADARVEIWPQGYARYSTSLDVPGDDSPTPSARGRLADGVGLIAIAGVDVMDHPLLDGAMESAHRSVAQLAPKVSTR